MEPLSAILGLGLSIFGAFEGHKASEAYNQAQQQQIGAEQKIEQQRYEMAQRKHERDQLEIVRTNQRARAMGLEAAVTQGANSGSAIAGAYGQFSGASGTNMLAENQSFQAGTETFRLNSQISGARLGMANAQQDMQTAQGLSSLGSSLFSSSQPLSRVFSGPSNSTPKTNYGGPFNFTGSLY